MTSDTYGISGCSCKPNDAQPWIVCLHADLVLSELDFTAAPAEVCRPGGFRHFRDLRGVK